MAVYQIIIMRDIRADICTMPEMWPTTGMAARAFEDRCNNDDPKDMVSKHPGDFELLHIGEYEDHTGTFLVYEGTDRKQLALGQKTATA